MTNNLIYTSRWLPKTKQMAYAFLRYWLRDLWFYGSIVLASLFTLSELMYKIQDISMMDFYANSNQVMQIKTTGDQIKITSLSHFMNILQKQGINETDQKKVKACLNKHINHLILNNALVKIAGKIESKDSDFIIDNIQIIASGIELIIKKDGENFQMQFVQGGEIVKRKFTKIKSIKHLQQKADLPLALLEQCKKAYNNNPFVFDPKMNIFIVYTNPSKNNNTYKLMLFAQGDKAKKCKGVILMNDKYKYKGKMRYLEKFQALGERADIKFSEQISYQDVPVSGNGSFIHPLPGYRISSGFGYRTSPRRGFHHGIDIVATVGTRVQAAMSGKVIMAQKYGAYGNVVIVSNGAWSTVYAHLHSYNVKKGDIIHAGDNIAKVGSTGRSTGAHLHFEIRKNNKAINPLIYIGGKQQYVKQKVRNMMKQKVLLAESHAITKHKLILLSGLI